MAGEALVQGSRRAVFTRFYSYSPRGVKADEAMISTVSLRMLKSWATK